MSFETTTVYHRTSRILNTNSVHFIAIALLFIPLINFFASSTVQFYFSSSFEPFDHRVVKTIITILAVAFFVILLALAEIALITYKTYQAIYNRPLTFSSTFKSLSGSYLPQLSTIFPGSVKLITISLLLTLSPIVVNEAFKVLGFHLDLTSFLNLVNTLLSFVIPLTITFFVVIWGSAAAIVILESKFGFEDLQQSKNQSRFHLFSIIFIISYASMACSAYAQSIESTRNCILILLASINFNLLSSLMILYYVVANTVLYVQCKVARGEEVVKMAVEGEVSDEYVSLVISEEDHDASHEPANEEATRGFNYILYFIYIVYIILIVLGIVFRN